MSTHKMGYPYTGCVVCGKAAAEERWHCTNNCCNACHSKFCGSGGETSPGHGIDLEEAKATVATSKP